MSLLPGAKRAKHQQPLVPNFWYWEPVWCIDQLFAEVTFKGPIHDPCCGAGRIPTVARRYGYEAAGSDLVDRGFGRSGVDFLTDRTPRQTIVCNPPSDKTSRTPTLRDRFVLHALEVAQEVAMIVPVPFQCGQWRRDNLFRRYPPQLILACSDRPSMPPGGSVIPAKNGTTDYCWIVWRQGHSGPTEWRALGGDRSHPAAVRTLIRRPGFWDLPRLQLELGEIEARRAYDRARQRTASARLGRSEREE